MYLNLNFYMNLNFARSHALSLVRVTFENLTFNVLYFSKINVDLYISRFHCKGNGFTFQKM